MPLVLAPSPPPPSARPMTLRSSSLTFTDGPMRKVTASAMWVRPKRGHVLQVFLGKPWTMLRSQEPPTVEDFMAAFVEQRFDETKGVDRVARWDGELLEFDIPMSLRQRVAIAQMLHDAHELLLAAHLASRPWPVPSASWTPWLLSDDSEAKRDDS